CVTLTGARANLAAVAVRRARAHAYTLLLSFSTDAINTTFYDNLNFNFIRDIAPVAGIARAPHVMVVHPSFAANTVAEFIAYAKANPGKITMASAGVGSTSHMAGELFKMMAGIDMLHVPYRGQVPALTTCSAAECKSISPPCRPRSDTSEPARCARWR